MEEEQKRVLVVDDEPDILTVVSLILSRYNFKVEAISKWEHIPGAIKSFNPDLILLDVCLSGGDGRVICKQLKSSEDTVHIPVILFSANYNLLDTLKGCKPDAVITKPFDSTDLVTVIQEKIVKPA